MLVEDGPWKGKQKRAKGAKGKGQTFEKKVGKFLKQEVGSGLWAWPWIAYEDEVRKGYAQPDFLIEQDDSLVLVEVKLSETELAWEQMDKLYRPLVEWIWGKPVERVAVFKNIKTLPEIEVCSVDGLCDGGVWHMPFV